jgi:hypothetical protein
MAESLDAPDVFSYITTESNSWKTTPIPLTNSKEWNMYEHIQRCKNVSNGWFHSGKNDGLRPYNDIVTPILNVAFRSEGFDVKDIVPYVNDAKFYYKSFLVKKYHPQWARKNELDTFIDEVVESSIIYDLVVVKDVNQTRPEVVDLTTLAFCDQTDVLAGPICIKHYYTPSELKKQKKWNKIAVDTAITQATQEKKVTLANDQTAKTPMKYVEVFELRGSLPAHWIEGGEYGEYTDQMHLVCFYNDAQGVRQGITLYAGEDKPLNEVFKALKIDQVRSRGRACGRSIVESLFEPQVWNNYAGIKIKDMLDSAINVIVSDSEELGNQKLKDLKQNTILKQEKGANTQRLDGTLQNLTAFQNYQVQQENNARIIGSASDAQLGTNPVSGTPFSLQALVVQQGQGIHEYRQGKIATFFADVLYRDLILGYLVKDMNAGKTFSEELTFEELDFIAETISNNKVEQKKKEMLIAGKIMKPEETDMLMEEYKMIVKKGGTRAFFEALKGELADIPMDVYVNIKGKQKDLPALAEKLTNLIREASANPQGASLFAKQYNELLESSGLSPVDFQNMTKTIEQPQEVPVTA